MLSLVFFSFFTFGLLVVSVFKKHIIINFATVLSALGTLSVVEIAAIQSKLWLEMAIILIVIYEIYEMSKFKGVK